MKRILALMTMTLLFIAAMPVHAAQVDTDVGYSFVQTMDENTLCQTMISDQSFLTVQNPGDYCFTAVKPFSLLYGLQDKQILTFDLDYQSELRSNYRTGIIQLNRSPGYHQTSSTSSGGISY